MPLQLSSHGSHSQIGRQPINYSNVFWPNAFRLDPADGLGYPRPAVHGARYLPRLGRDAGIYHAALRRMCCRASSNSCII